MKGNKLSSNRGKQGTGMRRIKHGCMGVPVWGRNVIKLKDVSEEILHEHATHRAIRHARASVGSIVSVCRRHKCRWINCR